MKKIFIAKTLSLKSRHEAIVYQRSDLCDEPDKRFENGSIFFSFQLMVCYLLFVARRDRGEGED